MEIAIITTQKQWDSWLIGAQNPPFQQSWDWGVVLVGEGKTVERLAVMHDGSAVLLAQVTYQKLPFGRYAYAVAGPSVLDLRLKIEDSYHVLCDYLKKQGCIFFRVEPQNVIQDTKYQILKSLDLTPSTTSILDLRKPFETLLAAMHKNTRYSIRQAESKGVTVKQEKNFEIFWSLMQKTSERNKLRLHEKKHYENILQNKNCVQLVAHAGATPVAVAVFWQFAGAMTYLFAASDYAYHELGAPYLLQKEAVALAQQLGCTQYDFFGIAPALEEQGTMNKEQASEYNYDRGHKYAGITKFKLGFGGSAVERPGTFDVVLKPVQYWVYGLLRKIRRLI